MAQYDKLINLGLLNQFLTKAKTIFAPKITASGILKGDGNGNVSAATAGTDYTTPAQSLALGLTGASVGDLVRVNAVDSNGKPTSWRKAPLCEIKCNKNLLDNWYFVGGGSQLGDGVFPINQRGQTTYSGAGYGIDRWTKASNASLKLGANGVKFTRTAATSYPTFTQKITGVKAGMTVTLSALVRTHLEAAGNFIMLRLMAGDNIVIWFNLNQSYSDFKLITGQVTCEKDITEVRFQFSDPSKTSSVGDWVEIQAVKLELGSEQTLCHNEGTEENPVWVLNEIPDYGEELRKCQKYYVKYYSTAWRIIGSVQIDNNIQRCLVVLPASMVNNPKSIAVNGQMQFLGNPSITVTIPPTSCAIENTNLYMYYTQDSSAQTGLFPIRLNASTLEISCEP